MRNPLSTRRRRRNYGRSRIRSLEKMACVCAIMIFEGLTFRDAQNRVREWNLPCNGLVPDRSAIARFLKTILVG